MKANRKRSRARSTSPKTKPAAVRSVAFTDEEEEFFRAGSTGEFEQSEPEHAERPSLFRRLFSRLQAA